MTAAAERCPVTIERVAAYCFATCDCDCEDGTVGDEYCGRCGGDAMLFIDLTPAMNVASCIAAAATIQAHESRLREEVSRLRAGLIEYGQHEIGCPDWFRQVGASVPAALDGEPCDCGLAAALEGT